MWQAYDNKLLKNLEIIETRIKEPPQDIIRGVIKLLEQGSNQECLEKISRLELKYPLSLTLHTASGFAYIAMKNFDDALKCFQTATFIEPETQILILT